MSHPVTRLATKHKTSSASRKGGSVLVAVLAMIGLLSFLVTRFMDEALEDLEYRAIFNEPLDVRAFAYSLLEVSLATIQEVALIEESKLYAPEQGWNDPLEYAEIEIPHGWHASISIRDESGKLPINDLKEEFLNKWLEETFDFDFGTSRELSSSLLDWTDANQNRRLNGAESEDYLRRNPPYRAADGPLQSLEELRLIQAWEDHFFDESGAPNEAFQRLSRMASVYSSGAVNINSTSQEVLDILALDGGFDPSFVFDGLDKPYLTQVPGSSNSTRAGVEVRLIRITVSLSRGEVPFTISALVEPKFSDGSSSRQATGGRQQSDVIRTGTTEEQDALNYPFRILHISEYADHSQTSTDSARYSSIDIGED